MCRHLDIDKEVSCHEQLHYRAVSCVASTREGDMIATGNMTTCNILINMISGSEDRSVRTWIFRKDVSMGGSRVRKLEHHVSIYNFVVYMHLKTFRRHFVDIRELY